MSGARSRDYDIMEDNGGSNIRPSNSVEETFIKGPIIRSKSRLIDPHTSGDLKQNWKRENGFGSSPYRDPDGESEVLERFTVKSYIRQTMPKKRVLELSTRQVRDNQLPIRSDDASHNGTVKDGNTPNDARWTKISRKLVSPEALEAESERFEAQDDCVIVLRVLTHDEVRRYVEVTQRIKEQNGEDTEAVGTMGRVPKSTRPRPWRPSLWSKLPAWKWQSPVKLVDEYESTETFLKGHSIHIDDDDEPPISHGTTTTDDDPSTPQQDGKERENGKVTLREYSHVSEGETESEPCEPQHAKDFEHVRVSDPAGDYVIRRYQLQCPVVLPEGHLCKEKKKHQSDYGCSKHPGPLHPVHRPDPLPYQGPIDSATRSQKSVKSARSGASSIASVADSVFSFVSGSSMSSVAGPQSAVDRLVASILSDSVIKSLCTEGLGVFERERFERNLRRLLKEFAIALRKEAETQDERHAANFVRVRARNSAHMICTNLDHTKKAKEALDIEFENVSEESDVDTSDEEVDDLQHLEAFIRGSVALDSLRDSLKNFIHSQGASKADAAQRHSLARHDVREVQPSKPSPSTPHSSRHQFSRTRSIDELEVTKEYNSQKLLQAPEFGPSSVSYVHPLYDGSGYVIVSRLTRRGIGEDIAGSPARRHALKDRLLPKSFEILKTSIIEQWTRSMFKTEQLKATRGCSVRYKCKCGVTIVDDVVQLQVGGAERLQSTLQQSLLKGTSSSAVSRVTSFGQAFSGLLQVFSKATKVDSNNSPELPMHEIRSSNIPTEGDNSQPDISPTNPIELVYLLICYNKARYEERLLQLDLTKLGTGGDKALFESLRENYYELKKWPSRWLSLRSLQSIQFVQFEMYKSELVDIKQRDKLPPPEDEGYRYAPAPPETMPPIGNNYLMHVFQNPDCADDDPLCLSKFPKKLKEKLSCKKGVKPGWGLQFIEGWDGKKLWILGFMFFGLGSLTFGIVWVVLKHSIQDAFAIAAYMVAFGTMSIGTVQALLVM